MNWDDEIIDALDVGLEQASVEIEETRLRMKTYPIVSFFGYHELRYMQGWRPLGLKEYVLRLQERQKRAIERQIQQSIRAKNARIIRQTGLKDNKGPSFFD